MGSRGINNDMGLDMKRMLFWVCLTLATSGNAAFAEDMHEHSGKAYKTEVLAKSSNSWDGTPLPEYPRGTPEVAVLKITIAPGQQLPMHKHPVINAGVILSGELTVFTEDNKTLHLKPGEALIELVDKWHYGKNEGKVPVEIVVFYASAVGEKLAVSKK